MKAKIILASILLISIFLASCASNRTSPYQNYNQQPQGQPQGGQYVGGGCGVAPQSDYENTPIGDFGRTADSA